MAVVADILLALLTVVGALALLVLLMPLSVRARGAADGLDLVFEVRGSWGFGFISVRWRAFEAATLHILGIRVARLRRATPEAREAKRQKARERAEARARKGKLPKKKKNRGLFWSVRHRRTLWRAALRMVRTLHLEGRVAGVVGMPDPDETAWLGLALGELEARLPPGVLDVAVDYTDEVLAVGGHLRSRIWPAEVLVVLATVRFGGEMRRALRAA
ncbi:MAG: hypothetical protein CVU56_00155 [Deltaproteobacteria bacterium HGW-Deltaproteobacteria-14]|nr:MAG: hypothetical protein CVU56_00155 [Deltaproteobacteria bacterium HGW-Deltaproteobacteria-14]